MCKTCPQCSGKKKRMQEGLHKSCMLTDADRALAADYASVSSKN